MDRKLNVLIVDDSQTVREQLARLLGEMEDVALVGMAENGAAGIRMTGEARPDLVLMDLVMPGLDGLSALRTIRAQHPEVEVAMVSSQAATAGRAEQALKWGACAVLSKPVPGELIEALVERVRAGLEKGPREDPAPVRSAAD